MEGAVIAAGLLGTAIASVLLAWTRRRASRGDRRAAALEREASERLAAALAPGVGTHLDAQLEVDEIAVVADEDGCRRYVPVVRVDLDTSDAPGPKLRFEFVAPIVEAIAPAFAGERVHHYDVRFTFGPDGLLVSGPCRRVAVTPELAARLDDPAYRAFDLRRDLERRDDGGEQPPVRWGECVDHPRSPGSAE